MTFKNLTTVNSPIALLFGLVFLLVPKQTLEFYDVTGASTGEIQSVGQLFGGTLITLGIILWSIREMEDSDIRRNITIAFFVGNAIGVIVSLIIQIEERANAFGWTTVLIYLLLTLGFGYFLFMKPSEKSPES